MSQIILNPAIWEIQPRRSIHGLRKRYAAIQELAHPSAFSEYARVRDALKTIVQTHCSNAGLTLLLITATTSDPQGPHDFEPVPTISIIADDIHRIRGEVEAVGTTLRVQIDAGIIERAATPRPRSGTLQGPAYTDYHQTPMMGRSIGVAGVPGSGTLGIYLAGVRTGTIYGLTNGHVAMMKIKERIPGTVLPYAVPDDRKAEIVQPSFEDYTAEVTAAREKKKEWAEMDATCAGTKPRVRQLLGQAEKELAHVESRNLDFGKTVYGHVGPSSVGETRRAWIDVALIEVKKDRVGGNVYAEGRYFVAGTAQPVAGMAVRKADGRTTGCTEGVVNGAFADIWFDGALTEEWIILSPSNKASRVSDKGDSGSVFVQSKSAAQSPVVAQMWAGGLRLDGDHGRQFGGYEYTIVTPIADVLEHLKAAVGEELEVVSGEDFLLELLLSRKQVLPGVLPEA